MTHFISSFIIKYELNKNEENHDNFNCKLVPELENMTVNVIEYRTATEGGRSARPWLSYYVYFNGYVY